MTDREDVDGHQWLLIPDGHTVVVIPAPVDDNPAIVRAEE